MSQRIKDRGVEKYSMGLWSYIIIIGQNNRQLTIISIYCACKNIIQDSGSSTAISQQWDKMEDRGDLKIDIRKYVMEMYDGRSNSVHQWTKGKI